LTYCAAGQNSAALCLVHAEGEMHRCSFLKDFLKCQGCYLTAQINYNILHFCSHFDPKSTKCAQRDSSRRNCRENWGVGVEDPQRSLPTPNILWFCELQRAVVFQLAQAGLSPSASAERMCFCAKVLNQHRPKPEEKQ